jgi:hypothetical protein
LISMKTSIFTNGWNWRNTTVRRVLLMTMLFTSLNIFAQDSDAPDMALLEFLGEGVKVGSDVVDPMTWQAMEDMTGSNQNNRQQVKQSQVQDANQQATRRQDHE